MHANGIGLPRRHLHLTIFSLVLLTALSACNTSSDGESGSVQGPLEINGTYTDEFGTDQTITSSAWSDSFANIFHILSYSNDSNYLIAKNDPANAFNPDLYSRFDWTRFNSDLYYCQTAFDAATAADAKAAQADPTDPTTGGCDVVGNFSWTNLTP